MKIVKHFLHSSLDTFKVTPLAVKRRKMAHSEYLETCLILPDLYIECRNQTDYITLLAPPHVAIPLPAAIRLSLLKRRKMVVSEYFEILLPCLILPEQ